MILKHFSNPILICQAGCPPPGSSDCDDFVSNNNLGQDDQQDKEASCQS